MKKLNLLPLEMKYDEVYKAVKRFMAVVALIPVVYMLYLGVINFKTYQDIRDIKQVIAEVDSVKTSIENTKQNIKTTQKLHDNINTTEFPFTEFVRFINTKTPIDLNIISIDTEDKLASIVEGEIDTIVSTPEIKPTDVISSGIDKESDLDKVLKGDEEIIEQELVNEIEDTSKNRLGEIVVRGYSKNNVSIANFIYNISLLEFVSDVQLTAIEEKETTEGVANVFELVLNAK